MKPWLRIVVAIAVGVAGALATFVLTDRIGGIAQPILGPTVGTILAGIVAVGGIAITAAVAFSIIRPHPRTSSR
jgi:hypothetical protein